MFARIGIMRALTVTLNACSIRRGKRSIGESGSRRGIDDGHLAVAEKAVDRGSRPEKAVS
jgi:hypothetical protein